MVQATEALQRYQPDLVAVDGNLSVSCLKAVVAQCVRDQVKGQSTAQMYALFALLILLSFLVSTQYLPSSNSNHYLSEPTSVTKCTRILPAVATALELSLEASPITFASPNLLELSQLYQSASTEPLELTSHQAWWKTIDVMGLGTEFRLGLEHLARREACDTDSNKGKLSFLVEKGFAQMAINLLPFFQHLIIKCGTLGIVTVFRLSGEEASTSLWAGERTNVKARQVVGHGRSGNIVVLKHFPALSLDKGQIVNVTGAGDSLVGSILASLIQTPGAFSNPTTLNYIIHKAQEVC